MKRFWQASTTKDGKPATLFVETYQAAIAYDLAQGEPGSLIRWAVYGPIPASEDALHRALAYGAFHRHAMAPGYGAVGEMMPADSIPPSLESSWSAGRIGDACAVVIFVRND